jgi:site-specific recombinase XerD
VADKGDFGGAAHLQLVAGAALLHPEEQVFEAMLTGWRAQMTSRYLSATTVRQREQLVRRFHTWTNEYPWRWSPGDIEEWTTAAIAERRLTHSTVRNYHLTLRLFCDYLTDARYGWPGECESRFGTHPQQICHEWNTVVHLSAFEGRPGNRPLKRAELQALFDHLDERVSDKRRRGRKGWLAAFRDATLFKVAYAFGLRRREVAMLDVGDFSANPKAPEFGDLGVLSVRWGKAMRGGPPRRRSVLTVMPWSVDVVGEYLGEVRSAYGDVGPAMWPTERGGRVELANLNKVFAAARTELGLPGELGCHCLRHSYVTHLMEDGFDPLFIQQQVGHSWASTTALYTGVSSDFKNQVLRSALDRLADNARS